MHGTWNDRHPLSAQLLMLEGDSGTATGDAPTTATTPPAEKTLSQSEVDRIVQGRVGETKRQTEEAIAKQLGVPIEEAKRIIEAANAASDKDKTEAQLAREKADRETAAAEESKTVAAKERHDAAVERALLRALPKDLDDDALDKKLARITRLLDVEVGADAAAITKAVADLKKDEPLLFGEPDAGKGRVPDSDPKGTPPKQKGSEDAFSRGQERAKATAGRSQYSMLDTKT
jgi:hypothetical protein